MSTSSGYRPNGFSFRFWPSQRQLDIAVLVPTDGVDSLSWRWTTVATNLWSCWTVRCCCSIWWFHSETDESLGICSRKRWVPRLVFPIFSHWMRRRFVWLCSNSNWRIGKKRNFRNLVLRWLHPQQCIVCHRKLDSPIEKLQIFRIGSFDSQRSR